jgi:hypothetical protein
MLGKIDVIWQGWTQEKERYFFNRPFIRKSNQWEHLNDSEEEC